MSERIRTNWDRNAQTRLEKLEELARLVFCQRGLEILDMPNSISRMNMVENRKRIDELLKELDIK